MSLEGNVAVLMGGGAIAKGYAFALAKAGTELVIASRGTSGEMLAQEIDSKTAVRALWVQADAANPEEVQTVFDRAVETFGKVDILINGAGGNDPKAGVKNIGDFVSTGYAAIEATLRNNLYTKICATQRFASYLLGAGHQGSVVNICSMSGSNPLTRGVYYSAANSGLNSFVRSAAALFAHAKIGRVNGIAVGFVKGEQNKALLEDASGRPTPRAEEITAATSLKRFLTPEDVAPTVLHLADSEASGAVNGAIYNVDGGYAIVGLHQTGYT